MGITAFPAALQPIIQQGFLERQFQSGLQSRLGFRAIADRETFAIGIGETLTKTRTGLKAAATTPLTPSGNTNLDNGLTPAGFSVEQYTMALAMYGDTIDLNMVTSRVAIASQFEKNAYVNGEQAMKTLDVLARDALFGAYLGGNTRVVTTLGAPGTTVAVDDIRGFRYVLVNGVMTAVSATHVLAVTINGAAYTCTGATADEVNVSTAPGGISGTLTLSANCSVANGTAANAVVAATAPMVYRPSARATTAALVAGDTLKMKNVLQAVADLRSNNVPTVDGRYHCYLDDRQILGLFDDTQFQYLYRGQYGSEAYQEGQIIDLMGVRFAPNNLAPQQATLGAGAIHRGIVCGAGALVEGNYAATGYTDVDNPDSLKVMVDDVCMVTREPLDRLQQIIAQSWYWIGGYAVPTDATANATVLPTATNSYFKRAVVLESL
jgi:hypothetical protein